MTIEPVTVNCPADVWTKVADGVSAVLLHRKSTMPGGYLWTYRLAGNPAPTDASEGVVAFDEGDTKNFQTELPVDIYIRPLRQAGIVRVDVGLGGIGNLVDVLVRDADAPPIILPLVSAIADTTLTNAVAVDDKTFDVDSTTGIIVGVHLRIITLSGFYDGEVVALVGSTVEVDSPLDAAFLAGSQVTISSMEMAVDGSVTPVEFVLRTGGPSIAATGDITRIMMSCRTATPVNLSLFGDLPRLRNGIILRKINGDIDNVFNAKSNQDLVLLAHDWQPTAAINPAQGADGFSWRLTFAGQDKLGVALRVGPDGNLIVIVQDDLSGLLSLNMLVEGHLEIP